MANRIDEIIEELEKIADEAEKKLRDEKWQQQKFLTKLKAVTNPE